MSANKKSKLIRTKSGQVDPFDRAYTVDGDVTWKKVCKAPERRYTIQGDDSGHEYFVEVGMEGEFECWLSTFEDNIAEENYEGHDYEKNRIDGRFTFTDPRNE